MARSYQSGDEPVPGSGYRLTQFLGRGGFGEVWKASAPGGTEAAVKILHLGDTKGRKEFRALQVVKRIRHPNLVPITAFWLKGEDGTVLDDARVPEEAPVDETPASTLRETIAAPPRFEQPQASELVIVMGLGDKSLFDRLQECREEGLSGIPHEELLHYMEDTAEAIDFLNSSLHDLGSGPVAVQHCDIKPHNIMIVGGATQICDFGLARIAGAVRATTTTAGTVAYVAPEFLKEGKPSQFTDQYSLAITYFELATGKLPYLEETYLGVANAVLQGNLDLSMVSAAEQAVLRRATALDPAQRYPTCAEMVAALRQAGQPETGSAMMIPPADQRPARRRPRVFSLLNLLTLAVVVAGVAALVVWSRHGGEEGAPPVEISALARAQEHAAAGQDRLAIDDFTEALKDNPKEGEAYFGRGACFLRLADYDKAITDLQQAQRLEPDKYASPRELEEAFFRRGSLRFEKGDFPAAAADFSEAIRLGPLQPAAYFQRGRCALKTSDYDNAIADYEKAAELAPGQYASDPTFAPAYLARGTRWLEQQQDAKAIDDLTEAIRLDPHEPRALSRRGAARYRKEDWQGAVEDFSAAIQIEPNDIDLVMRARAYRKLKKVDDAIADLREAVRINPANAAAFYYLGESLLEKEDYEKASAALAQAIAKDPDGSDPSFALSDAYYFHAYCSVLTEKYDAAIADLGKAIGLQPKDLLSIYDLRASAFELAGRKSLAAYDQQIVAGLKRLQEKPDDLDTCRKLALLMASCPQPEIRNGKKALELARRACELTAWKGARDLDLLGMACAETGQFDEAAKWAAKAVELAPEGPERKQYEQRLEAYRSGKPYHQPPSPPAS